MDTYSPVGVNLAGHLKILYITFYIGLPIFESYINELYTFVCAWLLLFINVLMKFFHTVLYSNGLFILIFIYSFLLSPFYEYIKMYPFYHCQTSRLLLVLHHYDNIYFFQ